MKRAAYFLRPLFALSVCLFFCALELTGEQDQHIRQNVPTLTLTTHIAF